MLQGSETALRGDDKLRLLHQASNDAFPLEFRHEIYLK